MVSNEEILLIVRAQQLGIFKSDSADSLQRNLENARKALEENDADR